MQKKISHKKQQDVLCILSLSRGVGIDFPCVGSYIQ